MNFFKLSKNTKKSIQAQLFTQYASSTLVSGSLKKIVALPKYVESNEWIAVNTFDFFNHINNFYGIFSEFCTASTCPIMCAAPGTEYTWVDSKSKIIRMHAPQYVDCAMSWIQNLVSDETVFPTKADAEFPKDFVATLRLIYKHLLRVLAHLYHIHYTHILHLSIEAHLNTLCAHFICFAREFDLLTDKKELAALSDVMSEWEGGLNLI